jgi:ferritin-like metal-binding protein YciE
MKTLADIFEHTLRAIYSAENAITKALPKVAKDAKDAKLKKAAEDHLEETKAQIKKLDQVFKSIGKKASGEKCDATEGLIKEADGLMEEASGTALDAGLLAACQAVEHYEISRSRFSARLGQGPRTRRSAQTAERNSRPGKGDQQQTHQSRGDIGQQDDLTAAGRLRS